LTFFTGEKIASIGMASIGMLRRLVALGLHVAAALLAGHLHLEVTVLTDRGDHQVLVEDLDAVRDLDVGGPHQAGALLVDAQGLLLEGVHLDQDILDVEDDVGHVLGDAQDAP
jgi:hypothetical protein